jgi:hypothetical protein
MVLHLAMDMTCTFLTTHQVTRIHIHMQVMHTMLHQAVVLDGAPFSPVALNLHQMT